MNFRSVAGGAVAAAFFAGVLALATSSAAYNPAPGSPEVFDFEAPPAYSVVVPQFSDVEIGQFLSTLDAKLAVVPNDEKWGEGARMTLTTFSRRLQLGRLSGAQESRVLDHLTTIEKAHPGDQTIQGARFTVKALTVGKKAPEIVGKDLDGADMRLSDYRGKVVVVMFWGEWCGICRTEYPYERFLQEMYKNWPFAIVGVNSDGTRDVARQAAADNGLTYRSWWDGGLASSPTSIASAWQVGGWPTVYLLDGRGVIRYVDLGHEDLLKGVSQLLTEETALPDVNNIAKRRD